MPARMVQLLYSVQWSRIHSVTLYRVSRRVLHVYQGVYAANLVTMIYTHSDKRLRHIDVLFAFNHCFELSVFIKYICVIDEGRIVDLEIFLPKAVSRVTD